MTFYFQQNLLDQCFQTACHAHTRKAYMSHVMRKPVYAICEQQRRRPACAFAQSDQRLCCSLPRQNNISSFYIRNFKPLASFFSWPGRFVSYLVANPKDRFSRDEAHIQNAHHTECHTGTGWKLLPYNDLYEDPNSLKQILHNYVKKRHKMLHCCHIF